MKRHTWMAAGLWLALAPAHALEYSWDDFDFKLKNRLSTGVALRMEGIDYDLIGKTNVPGQENLCSRDSCLSITGNPEPNQRIVNAKGAYAGVNGDNGDLNYDRYDIVAATNRLSSDLVVTHDNYLARVRGIFYYDPVNASFDERHNDTRFQPAETRRNRAVRDDYAQGVALYDAYVQSAFQFNGRDAALSVGYQTVRWGESTYIARNSLAEINPPDSTVLHTPGADLNEIFKPVAAAVLSGQITDTVSAELFYQLQWKKIQPDPAGSFFGDLDLIDGDYAIIGMGQLGEDPNKQQRANGPVSLLSSTSVTVYPGRPHEPHDMGQFGVHLSYLADWLNGAELGVYALNYHSRYPYLTVTATDASCTRGVGPNGTVSDSQVPNSTTAIVDCRGFNGSLLGREDQHNPEREPLPIDTLRLYLDYPENIQMYGLSFNTTIGTISLAGEYSFRPNLPLQIQISDVVQTGLQPAFPSQDFLIDPTGLLNAFNPVLSTLTPDQLADFQQLLSSRFPGANTAVPSYLKTYRNLGSIQPHQVIPGYERFPVGQLDLTAIKAFSSNPFGADQILLIGEAAFTQVYGLPSTNRLQIETGDPNRTHASIGQDEKGPNDFATLNPHRQTDGFADSFSWGVRTIITGEYNDVLYGWTVNPQIILQWDIKGTAPYPVQNFVEGRKQFDLGATVHFNEALSARVNYQIYTGAGRFNTLSDRDNLALSAAYSF